MIESHSKLPQNWILTEVNKIGKIETGTTPSKKEKENYGDDFPFYKPTELESGINVKDSREKLSKIGIKKARMIPKNSILVTCIGSIGKTGLIRKEGAFNQQINAIIPYIGINPYYVYYQAITHFFQKQIIQNASSTTLPILNKSRFSKLKFILAPKNEQNCIVEKIEELFSGLDKATEELEKVRGQLKVYRQSVLKAAFEGKLTEEWREENDDILKVEDLLQEIAGDKEKRICIKNNKKKNVRKNSVFEKKQELLPLIPKTWKWVETSSIAYDIQYGYTESASNKPIGCKFLRITDIQNNKVVWENVPYCAISDKLKNKYILEDGDMLFARTGATVGKSYIIRGRIPESIFASYLIRLKLSFLINKLYVNYFFKSLIYWNQIKAGQVGTGQPNFNGTKLGELFIPVCSIEEQNQIVQEIETRLSVCDKIEESVGSGLKKIEHLRQSILKKAFEGKLVPQWTDLPAPQPGKYWVYVVKCNNDSNYISFTSNLRKRWEQHLNGDGADWTKRYKPKYLMYWEEFDNQEDAVTREKQLKTGYGRKWIKREEEKGRLWRAGEPAKELIEQIKIEKEKAKNKSKKKKVKA